MFFITLKEWGHRKAPEEQYNCHHEAREQRAFQNPGAARIRVFSARDSRHRHQRRRDVHFQDRSGKDVAFLAENVEKFVAAAREKEGTRRRHADVFTRRAAGFPERGPRQGAQAERRSECRLSDASDLHGRAISSTTSTDSAANGRFSCRPRATTAEASIRSGSSS